MASRKRQTRTQNAFSGAVAAMRRADWKRIALVSAGVVGAALVVGAVARNRTARRVGLVGLAHLAERNAGRIAGATQNLASRVWPHVRDAASGVARAPVALISRT